MKSVTLPVLLLSLSVAAGAVRAADPGDQVRLSSMGPDGFSSFEVLAADVSYGTATDRALVVWIGDDDTAPLVSGEFEVFGQLVDGATGLPVGADDFRISRMGPDADNSYGPARCTLTPDPACGPAVAYSSASDVHLVVWSSDDDGGALVEGEHEIFARRVDGGTGAVLDADDVRLSKTGTDGDAAVDAAEPDVAYDPDEDAFLVVWSAPVSVDFLDRELEIFARRVNAATGQPIETSDVRVSIQGPTGTGAASFDADQPAVAYDEAQHRYLVVWRGDDEAGDLVDNEYEIYGRFVSATASPVGAQFRITAFGPDGEKDLDAEFPDLVANPATGELLLVWQGTDEDLPEEASEIHAQRLSATSGATLATTQVSDMGGPGDLLRSALRPRVALDAPGRGYLIVWQGDDDRAGLANEELEIFGQALDDSGAEIGDDDFRVSRMGPDGNASYDADKPAVAVSPATGAALVVWRGDDDGAPLVQDELEVWSNGFGADLVFADGFETGDISRWLAVRATAGR